MNKYRINRLLVVLFLLFLLFIESLIFKNLTSDFSQNLFGVLLSFINAIFLYFLLLHNRNLENRNINLLIFISYVVRLIILILDVFCHANVFSGSDTEMFYEAALGQLSFLPNYSKFLKYIMLFFGSSRFILEYVNVFLSTITILILKKLILLLSNDNYRITKNSIMIFAFWPNNILLSGALLRETLMIFLNALSLYYFIIWYKENKTLAFMLSCLLMLLSSYYHSGMLFVIIGYGLFYILYNHELHRFNFHKKTIIYIIFVLLLFFGLYRLFGEYVTNYFDRVNSIEDISTRRVTGSTDYLSFTDNTTSKLLLIVYTPLKIIYFFFSPMIWDCHSIGTFLAFLFSSCMYMFLFYKSLKLKSYDSLLKKMLMLLIILFSITYSWGTSNSGTAMRHREKILPFIIVLYSIRRVEYKNEF